MMHGYGNVINDRVDNVNCVLCRIKLFSRLTFDSIGKEQRAYFVLLCLIICMLICQQMLLEWKLHE